MKKFEELIGPGNVLLAVAEIAPELVAQIPEKKWKRIEKSVLKKITTEQTKAVETELLNDGAVVFKKTLMIFTSLSTVRKTKNNQPVRKVSVRTRERMRRLYNQ